MPTLPNMSLVTPTLNGDSGAWDDKINAALALIDAHDHTSGKGARITPSAININANLGFGGFAITAAGQVAFTAVPALAAGSKVLFVSSADNELYWRTNGGTNVKLTTGNSINTSLVGGIVGDYSTVGAEVSYSDADQIYTFKDANANWARGGFGTVQLYEFNTSESVFVRLGVQAALASSYTVTFAAALPAGQSLLQIDTSGNLVYSNALATNADITLSGTGEYNHGDKKLSFVVTTNDAYTYSGAGHSATTSPANTSGISIAASADTRYQIKGLRQGMRVKSISIFGTSATEPNVAIRNQLQNAVSALAATASGTIVANSRKTFTLNTPLTISGDDEGLIVCMTGVTDPFIVFTVQVIYDVP